MKQFKITTADINPSSDDDCYLAPDDPIHALMPASQMGGLGSTTALSQYNSLQRPIIVGSTKGQEAREQNIEPGTQQWFKHWFGAKR